MSAGRAQKKITVQDVDGKDVEITIMELPFGEQEVAKTHCDIVRSGVIQEEHAKLANLSTRKGGGVRKLSQAISDLSYGGEESQGN